MSAVAGIFNSDGRPVLTGQLKAMTDAMAELGSRSENCWVSGHVGLGHRLSWFTPEDELELQPSTSRDGRFTVAFAGRVDNRRELAESLGISSAEKAHMPDSGFILAALDKWSGECLARLEGSFALAAFDRLTGSVLLARDPRGNQSLYYRADGPQITFASAPQALFVLTKSGREVNLRRVAEHLAGIPQDPESDAWFRGIHSVAAGSRITISRDGIRRSKFFVPGSVVPIRYPKDSDYVQAFDELWSRVVTDYMRRRGELGILLSGGLDSTAVASVAAPVLNQSGHRLLAFTERPSPGFQDRLPPGRYADEGPFVEAMASQFANIQLNFVRYEGSYLLDGIERYFEQAWSPQRGGYNRWWAEAIFASAARQEARILLDGQGGNLTISWTGDHLLPQLIVRGRWVRAIREARGLVRAGTSRSVPSALGSALLPLLPRALRKALLRARYPGREAYGRDGGQAILALIAPEFAREHRIVDRAAEFRNRLSSWRRDDPRAMTLGPKVGEGDSHRAYEAIFGIRTRSPAADPRIVRFCLALPESQFQRDGVKRWLIRRAMRDRVPSEILENRLRGRQSAEWVAQLYSGGRRAAAELDDLERSALARHVIDLPRLRLLLTQLRDCGAPNDGANADLRSVQIAQSLMMGRFLRWTETGL